jgi:hypothetical protein
MVEEGKGGENMRGSAGHASPSGVWIADDFRLNLIIDRYDPVFADMRASKIKHLRSVHSEDAVTWNVFRSLRQIAPDAWLPLLWSRAFDVPVPEDLNAVVTLWKSVAPPLGLLADGDEGASEIDVVIETTSWVWFVEAKYRGDISTRTTTRPKRDQVLRNLDVGTHYAGVRSFYFSLLIASDRKSPLGVRKLQEYADFNVVRESLVHRTDGVMNLRAIGKLTWSQLADVLAGAENVAARQDERAYASRAVEWLRARVLAPE